MENGRLAVELERLRGLHDDLRGSAEIWIRLYEAHLVNNARHPEHDDYVSGGSGPCVR